MSRTSRVTWAFVSSGVAYHKSEADDDEDDGEVVVVVVVVVVGEAVVVEVLMIEVTMILSTLSSEENNSTFREASDKVAFRKSRKGLSMLVEGLEVVEADSSEVLTTSS